MQLLYVVSRVPRADTTRRGGGEGQWKGGYGLNEGVGMWKGEAGQEEVIPVIFLCSDTSEDLRRDIKSMCFIAGS